MRRFAVSGGEGGPARPQQAVSKHLKLVSHESQNRRASRLGEPGQSGPLPAASALLHLIRRCAILKWMLQYLPTRPTPLEPPIDVVFHALSDANRRAMIDRLLDGPASVSELARPLAISLPAVVQHLHVLEASGVVRSHKVGRVRTCEIEPLALSTAERWISERRATWEAGLDRLGAFLAAGTDQSEPSAQSQKTRSKGRSK